MTHGSKVVNFLRLDLCDQGDEVGGIAKISVMQKEFNTSLMTISVQVINTPSVETGCSTDDTVNLK